MPTITLVLLRNSMVKNKVVLVFGKEALVSRKHLNTVLFYNQNAF